MQRRYPLKFLTVKPAELAQLIEVRRRVHLSNTAQESGGSREKHPVPTRHEVLKVISHLIYPLEYSIQTLS
ncbi:MAG: hypothetical protein DLM55_12475 [Acidimicrobiales bacterium]|nr:MAG: hypothetical protein DLM55_12475 [Acidimicrobiales bacterium]